MKKIRQENGCLQRSEFRIAGPNYPKETRFSNLPPWIAICITLSILFLSVYGFFTIESGNDAPGKKGVDLACQRSIVERIHDGEGYYEAAGKELRERGYATQSVFNWRLPFLALFLGCLPTIELGYFIGIMIAGGTLFLWIWLLRKEKALGQTLIGSLLLTGIVIYGGIPDLYFAHEFWAGTCIVLSVISYTRGWVILSLTAGGIALLIRELSFPFIMVMMMVSLFEKRWRESLVWLSITIGFFFILGIHAYYVQTFTGNVPLIQKNEWIGLGGWSFALKTIQMHPFLILIPPRLNALLVPFLLLGLTGWKGKLGSRVALSVYAYILSFVFVGQPFNIYWGTIFNSLVPLGVLYILPCLKDLWGSISRPPFHPRPLPYFGGRGEE